MQIFGNIMDVIEGGDSLESYSQWSMERVYRDKGNTYVTMVNSNSLPEEYK